MNLLLPALWPALVVALLLGMGFGWLSGLPKGVTVPLILSGAITGAWILDISGLVQGRPGLFVESATLLLPTYALGCLLGGLIRLATTRSAS